MSIIVKTYDLSKQLQGRKILSSVNMEVKKGQIYGLIGPNGAGKTTLFKLLLNILKPSEGKIECLGKSVEPSSYQYLAQIGSLIEYPIFYEQLTARENLEIHCRYMGYFRPHAVDEALQFVKLEKEEGKKVQFFSLGMKQRLGIARAWVTQPQLLILDEPLNGLDPEGMHVMKKQLRELSQKHGTAILISSHMLGEIEKMADRIGVIQAGRLLKEISMDEIRNSQLNYLELRSNHIQKAAYVLENHLRLSSLRIVQEDTLLIYDPISPQELSKQLVLNEVSIEALHRKQTSLEAYYLDLIHEGDHHV